MTKWEKPGTLLGTITVHDDPCAEVECGPEIRYEETSDPSVLVAMLERQWPRGYGGNASQALNILAVVLERFFGSKPVVEIEGELHRRGWRQINGAGA